MVVPPGEVTASLSWPGCFPDSRTIFALPYTVWAARVWAIGRGKPAWIVDRWQVSASIETFINYERNRCC